MGGMGLFQMWLEVLGFVFLVLPQYLKTLGASIFILFLPARNNASVITLVIIIIILYLNKQLSTGILNNICQGFKAWQ